MKRADHRHQEQFERLEGYILAVSKRLGRRTMLYGVDDLVQEASAVLWKIVTEYPQAEDVELIKIFKTSFRYRLASLFRSRAKEKPPAHHKSLVTGGAGDTVGDGDEIHIKIVLTGQAEVLPWHFYDSRLKQLGKEVGRKFLRSLVQANRQGRDFEKEREIIALHM